MSANGLRALKALALLAIAGVALGMCAHRSATPDRHLATVKSAAFEVRVDAVGVIDAARAFHVVSELRGDKGKVVHIAEDGQAVKSGDVLVRFDPSPFEADILRLTGEVRSRQAVVEYATQNLEVEKSQVEKNLAQGEYDFKSASQELSRFQAYIADLEGLGRKGYAIGNEVLQARRKEEQSFARVQKTESDLHRLRKESIFRVAQAAAELNKAKSELETSRAALSQSQTDLERALVRAPTGGFVVLHEIFQGNLKRRPRAGDTIWQGQPILYLPDLAALVVKTRVREEDLHKIRPGLGATVRADAFPDATFRGEVAGIGALAMESPGSNAAGKHFQLTVNLVAGDARLRPGMTARVTVVAEVVRDALVVPVPALFFEATRPVCYVFDGRGYEARAVSVGRRSEDLIEITAGLARGEQVSLVRPAP